MSSRFPCKLGSYSQPGHKNAHAFILRRYDTNAISLTTMYKVAFPGASEEDERREMEWVSSLASNMPLIPRSNHPTTRATPTVDVALTQSVWQDNGRLSAYSTL